MSPQLLASSLLFVLSFSTQASRVRVEETAVSHRRAAKAKGTLTLHFTAPQGGSCFYVYHARTVEEDPVELKLPADGQVTFPYEDVSKDSPVYLWFATYGDDCEGAQQTVACQAPSLCYTEDPNWFYIESAGDYEMEVHGSGSKATISLMSSEPAPTYSDASHLFADGAVTEPELATESDGSERISKGASQTPLEDSGEPAYEEGKLSHAELYAMVKHYPRNTAARKKEILSTIVQYVNDGSSNYISTPAGRGQFDLIDTICIEGVSTLLGSLYNFDADSPKTDLLGLYILRELGDENEKANRCIELANKYKKHEYQKVIEAMAI